MGLCQEGSTCRTRNKKLVGLENHQTGGNRTGYMFRAKFVEWIEPASMMRLQCKKKRPLDEDQFNSCSWFNLLTFCLRRAFFFTSWLKHALKMEISLKEWKSRAEGQTKLGVVFTYQNNARGTGRRRVRQRHPAGASGGRSRSGIS